MWFDFGEDEEENIFNRHYLLCRNIIGALVIPSLN